MASKGLVRKCAAAVLLATYLFAALFTQNFHNHGSGLYFKDFHFVKSEKSFSKSGEFAGTLDCLVCHFAHDGHTLLPEKFSVNLSKNTVFIRQLFIYKQKFSTLAIAVLSVRGPPYLI